MLPIVTGKSILGGWYFQGAPPGLNSFLSDAGFFTENFSRLIESPDLYAKLFSYVGVKYVIVYAYFADVINAFKHSMNFALKYSDTSWSYYVFQVMNSYERTCLLDGVTKDLIDLVKESNNIVRIEEGRLRVTLLNPSPITIITKKIAIPSESGKLLVELTIKTKDLSPIGRPWYNHLIIRYFDVNMQQLDEDWIEIPQGSTVATITKAFDTRGAKYIELYMDLQSRNQSVIEIVDLKICFLKPRFIPLLASSRVVPVHTYTEFLELLQVNNDLVAPLKDIETSITLDSDPYISNWRIQQSSLNVTVEFTISDKGFVVIPFGVKPNMLILIEPKEPVETHIAYFDFLALKIMEPGHYRVVIKVLPNNLGIYEFIISVLSIIALAPVLLLKGRYLRVGQSCKPQ
ncbi:MAG: hypothetical protein DRJ47_09430 [Thermoprotei archaeon]|nr:MAG: hypothetical protein DRJ47_09430 [Thermoprotei archaeon]